MSLAKGNRSLQEELDWAMARLEKAGFPIRSKVRLLVDPKLDIMGYADEQDGTRHIVIAEWAVRSEMLGGLLLHELAHIYHSERSSPSHKPKVIDAIISEFTMKEGLNERETGYLIEGFSYLQSIIADDIAVAAMLESERLQTRRFFSGWLTDAPSGYPVTDAAALVRNAFAVASLKRHGLLAEDDPTGREVLAKRLALAKHLGKGGQQKYESIEGFLVNVDASWDEQTFNERLVQYLDLLVAPLRETEGMEELR